MLLCLYDWENTLLYKATRGVLSEERWAVWTFKMTLLLAGFEPAREVPSALTTQLPVNKTKPKKLRSSVLIASKSGNNQTQVAHSLWPDIIHCLSCVTQHLAQISPAKSKQGVLKHQTARQRGEWKDLWTSISALSSWPLYCKISWSQSIGSKRFESCALHAINHFSNLLNVSAFLFKEMFYNMETKDYFLPAERKLKCLTASVTFPIFSWFGSQILAAKTLNVFLLQHSLQRDIFVRRSLHGKRLKC